MPYVYEHHSFSTSDFGETEPDVRLWLFKFAQHLDLPVGATFFFVCFVFIKVLIHHKGLLYVCSVCGSVCIFFVKCPSLV